jgi:pimeloyl-ACP methyl ester carboxylesterase
MTEHIQLRIHGSPDLPTIIYLPGLHGDWTLVRSFRTALGNRVRFVEITYPRSLSWSLEDYAAGIESALAEKSVTSGWLVAESFGSQIAWPFTARKKFNVQGVVLAGGFVKHPMRQAVRLAVRVSGAVPLKVITRILFGYARVARFRFRRSSEVMQDINEFIARRTELDRRAAQHRLKLVLHNDPCAIARDAHVPVYGLSGVLDPIVPWFPVRRWLKRNCPSLRDFKIIYRADHNVLGTAPKAAAQQVLAWMHSHSK